MGSAFQWGLASLILGCTMFLSSSLFRFGHEGPHRFLGTVIVFGFGIASIVFGVNGWQRAISQSASPALSMAGIIASGAGLLLWFLDSFDLLRFLDRF